MNGYSENAKNEILALTLSGDCCKRAFLSALIRAGGSLIISGGKIKIALTFSDKQVTKKAIKTLREISSGVVITESENETVLSGEVMLQVLYALGIFYSRNGETAVRSGIHPSFINENCCGAAYVRGCFLGCGSVSLVGGYHLEFHFSSLPLAEDIVKVLERFGIIAKIKERKNAYLVYVKDNEAVSDLLALMGATQAVIELNDRYMERQFSQRINRRTNCDIANINKTVAASMRIVESINYISSKIGIAALDEKLQAVAMARLENPDDSFAVLADGLGISKSTLKNRFKKLDDIALELKAKEKKD